MSEKSCKQLDMEMQEPFLMTRDRKYRNFSGLYACPRCNWNNPQPAGIQYGSSECPDCKSKLHWEEIG